NLSGRDIPDVPGKRYFTVQAGDLGELRVAEFLKMPFEVNIATPLRPVREGMKSYVQVCLLLLAAMLAASLVIGLGVAPLLLWPGRLRQAPANGFRSDNPSEGFPGPDVRNKSWYLPRLLNQLFVRLEASFIQIRRFTADASHELKMPLSLIRLHAEKM